MNNKPAIGLVMKALEADFFLKMKKGALAFAEKQNSFQLITVGTNTQIEIDSQIELVDNLINQKVDAIVLVPIDSKALIPITIKAIQAELKLLISTLNSMRICYKR